MSGVNFNDTTAKPTLTSTLTTKGDTYVATAASTIVRQAIGADNTVLTADSAQTNGLKWASIATIGKSIVSKTQADSPYTASTEDILLFAASSASTVNLPAGSTGRVIRITNINAPDNVNIITIDGNGAEAIRDSNTSATTTTLNTGGESIELTWDGTRWEVTDRRIPSIWTTYTPTVQGLGTLGGSTLAWMRQGGNIVVAGNLSLGTTSAAEARIGLPTNLTSISHSSTIRMVGQAVRSNSGATSIKQYSILMESSVTYFTAGAIDYTNAFNPFVKQNGSGIWSTSDAISLSPCITGIAGWNG